MVGSVAGSARSTTVTSQDHIDFFWRRDCQFCMSLDHRLHNAGVAFEHVT
jgi:hypothetical protein